jgi:Recombination endonuclease VII
MKGKTVVPDLTSERLREALDYDPKTGVFVWKISPAKNVKAGSVAGGFGKGNGYQYIRLDGVEYTCGRLAWFYVKGEWPERRIRYRNGNKSDNRFANLTLYNGIGGEYDHKTREGKIAYLRQYRKATPHLEQARHLRQTFGLSVKQYEAMLNEQDGKCAICRCPERIKRNGRLKALAVDHCHGTGAIRGLLCSDCNTGIGKLKDDPAVLRKAADYLEKFKT